MGQRTKRGLLAAALLTQALAVGAGGVAGAAAGPDGDDQRARVDSLLTGTTAGSPAQFRLVEERDRLSRVSKLADELDHVERVFRQATPGFPAQFRAREEADSLRAEIRTLDPTWEEAR